MCCIFRGRRSTLDVSIVIFRGRRNTLDVSCCVFIANRIGRAASSGDKVQISWQAWHFVTCAENWRKLRTKHRFWGSNFFQVLRKTRRKTSILKLQSVKSGGGLARNARFGAPTCLVSSFWFSCGLAVSIGEAAKLVLLSCCQLWKLEEVSHEMLVFLHPRVSSRVSGFPVASPCLWGKLQNISFSKVSKQVVMPFCMAGVAVCDIPTCLITCRKCQNWRRSRTKCNRNARFFAPKCLVSSLWFSCGVAVSMEEAAKPLFFEGFEAGCHVVLRGRRGTLWHSNLFDNVSKMSKLEEVSHEMLVFLHPSVSSRVSGFPVASPCLWAKLRTPHSTLYTPQFRL